LLALLAFGVTGSLFGAAPPVARDRASLLHQRRVALAREFDCLVEDPFYRERKLDYLIERASALLLEEREVAAGPAALAAVYERHVRGLRSLVAADADEILFLVVTMLRLEADGWRLVDVRAGKLPGPEGKAFEQVVTAWRWKLVKVLDWLARDGLFDVRVEPSRCLDRVRRLWEVDLATCRSASERQAAHRRYLALLAYTKYNRDPARVLEGRLRSLQVEIVMKRDELPPRDRGGPPKDTPAIRQLLKDRRSAAKALLERRWEDFRNGRGWIFYQVESARLLLETELDETSDPAERRAAYQQLLVTAREIDASFHSMFLAGRVTFRDSLECKIARIDAEIDLAKAVGGDRTRPLVRALLRERRETTRQWDDHEVLLIRVGRWSQTDAFERLLPRLNRELSLADGAAERRVCYRRHLARIGVLEPRLDRMHYLQRQRNDLADLRAQLQLEEIPAKAPDKDKRRLALLGERRAALSRLLALAVEEQYVEESVELRRQLLEVELALAADGEARLEIARQFVEQAKGREDLERLPRRFRGVSRTLLALQWAARLEGEAVVERLSGGKPAPLLKKAVAVCDEALNFEEKRDRGRPDPLVDLRKQGDLGEGPETRLVIARLRWRLVRENAAGDAERREADRAWRQHLEDWGLETDFKRRCEALDADALRGVPGVAAKVLQSRKDWQREREDGGPWESWRRDARIAHALYRAATASAKTQQQRRAAREQYAADLEMLRREKEKEAEWVRRNRWHDPLAWRLEGERLRAEIGLLDEAAKRAGK
jgi:hypothetical protein